jgi:mycofactocin precursor
MENEATLTAASTDTGAETQTATTTANTAATSSTDTAAAGLVDELLIEEISIDGMCGVY